MRPRKALPATEVKNRFGRVLKEVARTGGPIVVERDGVPVAVIVSVEAYERLAPSVPNHDQRQLALAGFGMWAGRSDVSDAWLKRGRQRWHSQWNNG
jgi:prevent-host-death family protein